MHDTKELRNRIKSVSGMGKIIKAMEMVASSKIRKAQNRIFEARPFLEKLEDFIAELSNFPDVFENSFIKKHERFENVLILAITADRGLCGGYNTNIIKLVNQKINEYELEGKNVKLNIIGTKGKNHFKYTGRPLNKVYENLSDYPCFLDAREIANDLIMEYLSDTVDKVELFYTEFKNTAEQKPVLKQVLPVPLSILRKELDFKNGNISSKDETIIDFIFEPSAQEVLSSLIPEYIYTVIYDALLESAASETGARMTAMRSASDSSDEMVKDLTRKYHRARQQQITIEIAEIASGAEALK
ncbi:MAG: ATP synthase F1 subunit gamma [Actinobacteria bacterium]|nr:ATP synthase F1 subunit gamma [Cyanobacteriota bacterium]MCL5771292.1 ATP synthase F1 subunit gamma [Actinomycetota bacterium]